MGKEIDLVVTWVDGSDPAWLNERRKFEDRNKTQHSFFFRNWGLMRYWFRGIEKNLPWIHKVFFLTWGHLPAWLNKDHPKLRIVRHEEFIPPEFLPTFSSVPIEWNIYRIKDLAEQFIYSNDDMFFIGPVSQDYYFRNNLPCDCLCLQPITEVNSGDFGHIVWNNINCINAHFSLKDCMEKYNEKWFAPVYSDRVLAMNKLGYQLHNFPGFYDDHLPIPFLKSTFEEVWETEPQMLRKTCCHRFRSMGDASDWLVRYWQLVKGDFIPRVPVGKFLSVTQPLDELRDTILDSNNPVVCLNEGVEEIDFEERSAYLRSLFEIILPEMSSFELY